MTVTVRPAVLGPAAAVNDAEKAPAAMITCAGTVKPGVSLESKAVTPCEGAGEANVTTHVAVLPAITKAGLQFNALIVPDPPPPDGGFPGGVPEEVVKDIEAD